MPCVIKGSCGQGLAAVHLGVHLQQCLLLCHSPGNSSLWPVSWRDHQRNLLWHYSIHRSSLRKFVRWWCSSSSSPTTTGWCLTFWVSISAGKGPHFTKNGSPFHKKWSPFWQIVTIYLRRSSGVRCFWYEVNSSSFFLVMQFCILSHNNRLVPNLLCPHFYITTKIILDKYSPLYPTMKVIRTPFLSELIPYCDTRITQDLEKTW